MNSLENGVKQENWYTLKLNGQVTGQVKLSLEVSGINYSVLDYAASFDQNSLKRKTMEDRHILIDKFGGVKHQGFFSIYDGHGGALVSGLLAEILHPVIQFEMKNFFF